MKNIRKLIISGIMVEVMLTVSAQAYFPDVSPSASYAKALETLCEIGIMTGYPDGEFKPENTVTRAEMAKMIFYLSSSIIDDSKYQETPTAFVDIDGHWARGYIKYCQSVGIIAGRRISIFDPNGPVKTNEAAKMVLGAMGLSSGLTGANWSATTQARAESNGLLRDVGCSFTGACPRKYAAQIIYNTLDLGYLEKKAPVERIESWLREFQQKKNNMTIKHLGDAATVYIQGDIQCVTEYFPSSVDEVLPRSINVDYFFHSKEPYCVIITNLRYEADEIHLYFWNGELIRSYDNNGTLSGDYQDYYEKAINVYQKAAANPNVQGILN